MNADLANGGLRALVDAKHDLQYALAPADHEQYLYETLDLFGVKDVEVNLAVGEGLTSESQSLIFKMILGYAF